MGFASLVLYGIFSFLVAWLGPNHSFWASDELKCEIERGIHKGGLGLVGRAINPLYRAVRAVAVRLVPTRPTQ